VLRALAALAQGETWLREVARTCMDTGDSRFARSHNIQSGSKATHAELSVAGLHCGLCSAIRVYHRRVSAANRGPSGESESETPQLLATKRVRRWGHSHVVTIPSEVRKALNVKAGDSIAFRKVGRYVFLAVVRAFAVAPVSEEEMRQAHAAIGD
jgi:antitoxin component of MazEF toxin-antitoxin module